MPSFTERFTEVAQFHDGHFPATRAVGAYGTPWLSMNVFHRAVVIIRIGNMGQGATFDLWVQEAQDIVGTNALTIPGKVITQLTQAGGDGNDTVVIELRGEELQPGYDYIRLQFLVSNATIDCDVFLLMLVPRFQAVNTAPLTEVVD